MRDITVGIDLGTTGVKVSAVTIDQKAIVSVSRENTLFSDGPGYAEADTEQWARNVADALSELLAHPSIDRSAVRAISTTGMVPAVVLVDGRRRAVRRAILQNDSRAVTEIRQVKEALSSVDVIAATGSAVTQQSVAPTMLWLQHNEPGKIAECEWLMGSYDWLLHWLGAEPHVEHNWALESGLYTISGDPFDAARTAGQVSQSLLPPVRRPGEAVGVLRSDLARDLGLPPTVTLVVGGADHVLSAYSAGVHSEGNWLIKLGGAGDILAASLTPITDRRLYLDAHPIDGLWLPNGCMATSGSLIRWFQAMTGGAALVDMDAEAATEAPGQVLCLPYFLGEKSPLHDPDLRGAFVGLHLGTSRGAMYRSVLEAIAFGFRHHVDVFTELSIPLTRATITNGGSKSTLWKHIHADVLGVPVFPVRDHPGASLGAAVLGAVGAGLLPSAACIDEFIALDDPIVPDMERHALYSEVYEQWRDLAHSLEPFSHYLAQKESRA